MSNFLLSNQLKIRGHKKSTLSSIALIALLSISIFLVFSPKVSAHTPPLDIPQWAYINALPNPIGQGQTISIFAWTATFPNTANGEYGDRWTDVTIVETKPDGTTKTLGPFTSDPVGTVFASDVAEQTGNYTFVAYFPEHKMENNPNGINPTQLTQAQDYADANHVSLDVAMARYLTGYAYLNDTYAACESGPATVTVQSEPIPGFPNYPLPTEYWTNPVAQPGHQNWAYIMGDWLSTGMQGSQINDYCQPPTTAHVAWTKPITFGGVGGQPLAIDIGGDNYYSMLSYETMYSPGIIMNGRLYYNIATPPEYGFVCVDLRTGEQLWYQNGTEAWSGTNSPNPIQIGGFNKNSYPQLSFGQELDYESPNQHGLISTLFATWTADNGTSVWSLFDPFTGNWICNLWNVPAYSVRFGSPSFTQDDGGNLMIYTPNFNAKTLTIWNSTAAITGTYETAATSRVGEVIYGNSSNSYWFYRPALGAQIDATIAGNTEVPITGNLPSDAGSTSLFALDREGQQLIYSNLQSVLGISSYPTRATYTQFAISIKPETLGQVLWSTEAARPAHNVTVIYRQDYTGSGVFAMFQKETKLWMAFSTTTGQPLWTSSVPELDNHMYGITGGIYNGVLYSGDASGTGGHIYAYDALTGDLIFDAVSPPMGFGGYWPNVPTGIGAFAAGQIYWYGPEHSPGPALEPGEFIGAMNATTGQPIWNISFWNGGGMKFSIANGYVVALNNYDNQIYSFGKGPTTTTIQTPLNMVTSGQSLVVQGTVMDISAGTKQSMIATRFPNGVPAVSDNDQSAWMEYVYMQNPAPTNAAGVPVTLTFIDPNGNYHQTSVTTDASGSFSLIVPSDMIPVEGKYSVVASFEGSGAYWPSNAQSSFAIGVQPTSTSTPTESTPSIADQYFLPAIAAIIILLIIGIALILLTLRKRP